MINKKTIDRIDKLFTDIRNNKVQISKNELEQLCIMVNNIEKLSQEICSFVDKFYNKDIKLKLVN